MIRPRGGDFLYTDEEFEQMLEEVRFARACGADCVVAGLLTPDGRIDEHRTAELVAEAGAMEMTFHRAFDMVRDQDEALEALVMLGFARTAAEKVLRAVVREEPSASVEELIRMALKRL